MKKILVALLIIWVSPFGAHSQDFIFPDTIRPPSKLMAMVQDSIASVISIDYTGDGTKDFVCTTISEHHTQTDWWISSDYKIVKEQPHWDAFYFFWFIQLDDDPELETYNAWGYPEGIDYYFVDYDFKAKTQRTLCNIYPVIIDSTERKIFYWGYPWDIQGVYMMGKKLLASIEHEIDSNEVEIQHPVWQKSLPIIFFKGKSTQPYAEVERFEAPEYYTIEQLINAITQD